MPRSIVILFPHPTAGPTGGYKVVYEYANRLANDGYDVHIVYSGSIFWSRKSLYHKFTACLRYIQKLFQGYSCRSWFALDKRIHEHFTFSLNQRHVPKADIYVATSPYTAYYLNEYNNLKNSYYFIEGYEDWGAGLRAILHDTYHYPLQKIVIARWLQKMLKERFNEASIWIPNGFDFTKFSLTISIQKKNRLLVSMLYHEMELKDCTMGFRALEIVKKRFENLRVSLFGVPERPKDLPDWFDYYKQPSDELHNTLNNEAAIFIGTSKEEGWGLTVGEAMMCGQAVCCTDNGGYQEMAIDGETALVSPVGDSETMANNIIRLIEDEELRYRIANNGYQFIQRFTWEESYHKLKTLFESCD